MNNGGGALLEPPRSGAPIQRQSIRDVSPSGGAATTEISMKEALKTTLPASSYRGGRAQTRSGADGARAFATCATPSLVRSLHPCGDPCATGRLSATLAGGTLGQPLSSALRQPLRGASGQPLRAPSGSRTFTEAAGLRSWPPPAGLAPDERRPHRVRRVRWPPLAGGWRPWRPPRPARGAGCHP